MNNVYVTGNKQQSPVLVLITYFRRLENCFYTYKEIFIYSYCDCCTSRQLSIFILSCLYFS